MNAIKFEKSRIQPLDCFRVSAKPQQIPLPTLHSLLRDEGEVNSGGTSTKQKNIVGNQLQSNTMR